MKIAQMSDLHFGPRNLVESERCFGFAVDQAIQRGVECAVITGDSTDHPLEVHSASYEALAKSVRKLADHCPVLLLQGTFSHEPLGTLNVFRLLGSRYPVHVADRIGQVALLEDGSWQIAERLCFEEIPTAARCLFSCVPTVNKAVVAGWAGGQVASVEVGEQIATVLSGFARSNEMARQLLVPTVGLSHGTVNGCITEHGVPMASLDHEYSTAALFSAGASAFMLGHIHRHQSWSYEKRVVAYPGSIGRFHYGEEGEKGFLLWDVQHDQCSFELIPTPARRTVDVVFEGAPDMAELQQLSEQLRGASVRVRWTVTEEERERVDRAAIEAILACASEVKMEGRIVPVVRTRAAGIGSCRTLAEKVGRWADTVDVAPEPLLSRLQMIECMAPEQIVAEVLGSPGKSTVQRAILPELELSTTPAIVSERGD